ncbi:MAG TPA: hypothetical protein VK463_09705 [Desulfomonilaceae bacterium]|nr:hypothetical protein [Desulfomonilaceae bacterium]
MTANGFLDHELVTRKVKVGNEYQVKTFPVVGGRLRIAHESNDRLEIETEILRLDTDLVVVKASVETGKGRFAGTGTASAQRDARLADSLVELAETRAVARALRFGGIGVEYTGAEEVSHVATAEPEREQTSNKEPVKVLQGDNGNSKPATKPNGNGAGSITQAQCRALYALTKRANYSDEDIASLLSPMNAAIFQDLSRESASQLITYLQTEVAA